MSEKDGFGSKVTPILKELNDSMWERDIFLDSHDIGPPEYPEEAMAYAAKIFAHVLFDLSFHKYIEDGRSQQSCEYMAQKSGETVSSIIFSSTGIDISDYIDERIKAHLIKQQQESN